MGKRYCTECRHFSRPNRVRSFAVCRNPEARALTGSFQSCQEARRSPCGHGGVLFEPREVRVPMWQRLIGWLFGAR
jgi:hypothetical protein